MARYSMPGPWTLHQRYNTPVGNVAILVGPLVDSRDRHVYEDGAHKVTVTGPTGCPRTKTFKGESAWCGAERYAEDAASWMRRWSLDH